MKLADKKQLIIDFATPKNGFITITEVINLLSRYYYTNAQKYIHEILSAMIKEGKIERVRTGYYRVIPSKNLKVEQKEMF